MKAANLKPFTKRISVCRVKDPQSGKTKQIKETHTVYAKNQKEANEKFDEYKRTRRAQILNIKEQRTLADVHAKLCPLCPLCLILCDPMDCSLPGSSVHGIF